MSAIMLGFAASGITTIMFSMQALTSLRAHVKFEFSFLVMQMVASGLMLAYAILEIDTVRAAPIICSHGAALVACAFIATQKLRERMAARAHSQRHCALCQLLPPQDTRTRPGVRPGTPRRGVGTEFHANETEPTAHRSTSSVPL